MKQTLFERAGKKAALLAIASTLVVMLSGCGNTFYGLGLDMERVGQRIHRQHSPYDTGYGTGGYGGSGYGTGGYGGSGYGGAGYGSGYSGGGYGGNPYYGPSGR